MYGTNPYQSWPLPVGPGPIEGDDMKERSPSHDMTHEIKFGTTLVKTGPTKKVKNPPPPGVSELIFHDSTDVTHTSVHTEPVNPQGSVAIEHLDLTNFKVTPCAIPSAHNHKQCPFYHNAKDRKRPGTFYSAELCDAAERDDGMSCHAGDLCVKSHNRVEQLYRPEKYKTKFCSQFPHNIRNCEYGVYCSFAHTEQDIIIDLIHNYEYDDDFYMFFFKTVLCPFNLTQHDKAQCVYAHNWQDFRRKPSQFNYDPQSCPNWKSTDYILNYQDGCPQGFDCSKCHGWKELEYHPLNYRTKQCNTKNCQKGRDCPFYHNAREKRMVSTNVSLKFFRHYPRNRIIANTFKRRSEGIGHHPIAHHSQGQLHIPMHQPTGMHAKYESQHHFNESKSPLDSTMNTGYHHFSINSMTKLNPSNMEAKRRASMEFDPRDHSMTAEKKSVFQEKYRRKLSSGEELFHPVVPNEANQELMKRLFTQNEKEESRRTDSIPDFQMTPIPNKNPPIPEESASPEKDPMPKEQREFLFNILEADDV